MIFERKFASCLAIAIGFGVINWTAFAIYKELSSSSLSSAETVILLPYIVIAGAAFASSLIAFGTGLVSIPLNDKASFFHSWYEKYSEIAIVFTILGAVYALVTDEWVVGYEDIGLQRALVPMAVVLLLGSFLIWKMNKFWLSLE